MYMGMQELGDHEEIRMSGDIIRVVPAGNHDLLSAEQEQYDKLTERERDVLRLVGQGYTAPEIGRRLTISPKTVDTYKQRIQEKLNLTHRSQYVQLALKLGLLAQTG